MSESAGTVPWRKTAWFWRWVVLAAPFGVVTVLTLVEAFLTDPMRGWQLAVGSVAVLLGLSLLAVLVFRVPLLRRAWALRRRDPAALVFIARRSLSTSPSLSAVAGREALTRREDECFLVAVRGSQLEVHPFDASVSPVVLELRQITELSVSRERMFMGKSNVLSLRFANAEAPVSFAVFEDRLLCAIEVRPGRLAGIRADIVDRSAAARSLSPSHTSRLEVRDQAEFEAP